MKSLLLYLSIIILLQIEGVAQQFFVSTIDFSKRKPTIVVKTNGEVISSPLRNLTWKKGVIKFLKLKENPKFNIDEVQYIYFYPRGNLNISSSVAKTTNNESNTTQSESVLDSSYLEFGIVEKESLAKDTSKFPYIDSLLKSGYIKTSFGIDSYDTQPKSVFMQLLNPFHCKRIRVYHNLFGKSTERIYNKGVKKLGKMPNELFYKSYDETMTYSVEDVYYDDMLFLTYNKYDYLYKKYQSYYSWDNFSQYTFDFDYNCVIAEFNFDEDIERMLESLSKSYDTKSIESLGEETEDKKKMKMKINRPHLLYMFFFLT